MTVRPIVRAALAIGCLVLSTAAPSFAHELVGVQSYQGCQLTQARAFLRSPNPGTGRQDFPLVVLNSAGNPTGEFLIVITVQNSSDFDARVTALGFDWPGNAGKFELVQLHRTYNALTTDNAGVRTGTIRPEDYTVVPSIAVTQAQGDVQFALRDNVRGVPGFPGASLDVALVTGNTFSGGKPSDGLATDAFRYQLAFKGVLPAGSRDDDIEVLLNDSFVRFRNVGPVGDGSETGIWRNLLAPLSCLTPTSTSPATSSRTRLASSPRLPDPARRSPARQRRETKKSDAVASTARRA